MTTKEQIKQELKKLATEMSEILNLIIKTRDDSPENYANALFSFSKGYQNWYSRAVKIVSLLGADRLDEFRSYYLGDQKRKSVQFSNYSIQDYIKGIEPRGFDIPSVLVLRLVAQRDILNSLASRIDGVLSDVEGHLLADLQDEELRAAQKLIDISPRAAGALAGVVLERHLQRAAQNHAIPITKKHPTIADLNDPLKNAGVYELATWRRIQLLADLRNLCSHSKDKDPTKDEVKDLISGVGWVVKTIF
jgi:hypothetical protein